jgi:hypothetical protein
MVNLLPQQRCDCRKRDEASRSPASLPMRVPEDRLEDAQFVGDHIVGGLPQGIGYLAAERDAESWQPHPDRW